MNAIANIKKTISISGAEVLMLTTYTDAINSMSALGVISANGGADFALLGRAFESIRQMCDQLEPLISRFDDDEHLPEAMKATLTGFETISVLAALVMMSIPNNPSIQILSVAFEKIRHTSELLLDLLERLELEVVL